MKLKLGQVSALFVVLMMAVGCNAPQNIAYFQDVNECSEVPLTASEITVKKGDKLSVVVNSKDPELSMMFNLPVSSSRIGSTSSSSNQMSCYSVDSDGNIDIPVLGKVNVLNCNREQIASKIKQMLTEGGLVNDAVVIVEFDNLYFSVMGEVANPGRFDIKHDRITILDALSMAGDLTINGKRQNIIVWREEGDQYKAYRVDLTSARDLYSSPVFNLQQKDIVYVEPNDTRKRQSTVNGNTVRSTSFWVSVASLITSITVMIVNLVK